MEGEKEAPICMIAANRESEEFPTQRRIQNANQSGLPLIALITKMNEVGYLLVHIYTIEAPERSKRMGR